ncbi:MAG: hypothetical protein DHS20C19_15220 [Acidimicrobiales bacterium]|nr:MAG: hypothetical protein DHS20C19_15220 [Acidimicrobiales bacterium]
MTLNGERFSTESTSMIDTRQMPFELFRMDPDGQLRPFRSVMRRTAVDRLLSEETEPVLAVDTNQLTVVGVSPTFPDKTISGMLFDEARARVSDAPVPAATIETAAAPPRTPPVRTHRDDSRLASTAELFGHLWTTLAIVVAVITVLVVLFDDEIPRLAVLLNGAFAAIVLASIGLLLRVGAATLRRSMGR